MHSVNQLSIFMKPARVRRCEDQAEAGLVAEKNGWCVLFSSNEVKTALPGWTASVVIMSKNGRAVKIVLERKRLTELIQSRVCAV